MILLADFPDQGLTDLCPSCKGKGVVYRSFVKRGSRLECPVCHGTGIRKLVVERIGSGPNIGNYAVKRNAGPVDEMEEECSRG